jgi:hypothetical protein
MPKGSMKGVVAAAAFALTSTAPISAHALCDVFGEASSLFAFPTGSLFVISQDPSAGLVFFCGVNDARLDAAAAAAVANNSRVVATGSNASCPTFGLGPRFIGTCTQISINPQ